MLHLSAWCYTRPMATTRPRHTITETDDVAAALDEAAERWPGESRSDLLRRLVREGRHALATARDERSASRLAAIDRASGSMTGVYGPDELARLREDWPE